MKQLAILFAIPLLLSLAACGGQEAPAQKKIPAAEEAIPVKVMDLQSGFFSEPVHAAGQFTTDDETYLSFKTGGVISSLLVKEGDYVRKGQLLATLDLTEIQAQVNQARIAHDKALRDQQRASNLFRDSVATLEQLQNSSTGVELSAQALQAARFNLQYSEIRAKSDGFILRKLANAGQVVGPGSPVFQTNGAGRSKWILRVGLSDREWSRVQVGDRAEISLDAQPGKVFPARLSHKMEGADPFNGSFIVELTISGAQPTQIAAGLFGKATIFPAQKAKSWAIPYEALLDGNDNTGYVFVSQDGKTARKVAVRISGLDRETVHISAGLDSARALIVSGNAYLKDGSPITLVK